VLFVFFVVKLFHPCGLDMPLNPRTRLLDHQSML
jgi:hypothetical protein